MKKTLIIIAIIITIIVIGKTDNNYYIIPKDAIRLRIVANSNSAYDQYIKTKVKQSLEQELSKTQENITSIDESRTIIKNNMDNYKQKIEQTLKLNNYNKEFTINYGQNYFPEKIYKGVKYEEGMYESLYITIGNGEGNNWWCVLFPPICNLEYEETNNNKIEYKFLVKDVINKYIK